MVEIQNNPLVSITIPAYNNPEYLEKTLKSIISQKYRPIEIIVSDDFSPINLESIIQSLHNGDIEITIKFFRQVNNLGMMGNFNFCLSKIQGKYFLPWAHDNWLIDPEFLSDAVGFLESEYNCYLYCANCKIEGTDEIMLDLKDLNFQKDSFYKMRGDLFSQKIGLKHWPNSFGWTQVTLLNYHMADIIGAFKIPYMIPPELAKLLKIPSDNGSSFLYALASYGDVILSNKIVAIAGSPPNSWSKTKEWGDHCNETMFFIFFGILRYKNNGRYSKGVKQGIKKSVTYCPIKYFNWKIIRHYHYNPEAIYLMSISYFLHIKIQVMALIHYYWNMNKALFNKIRNNEPINIKLYLQKIKENGLFYYLFPFRH